MKDYSGLILAARATTKVEGLTHNFYRYPARFSPIFASKAITTFTKPGDIVMDPFVGGGTTLVESGNLGRRGIGLDISQLAIFITKVKTTPISSNSLMRIGNWANRILAVNIQTMHKKPREWIQTGYQKNIGDSDTWRIRNYIEILLSRTEQLHDLDVADFIRCAILKTGQWALDGRKNIPSVNSFRKNFHANINQMLIEIEEYSKKIESIAADKKWENGASSKTFNLSATEILKEDFLLANSPSLILTSPPYPGIHVLYHRWQVQGRRETPAPFWIADRYDGNGESYYTFGPRSSKTHDLYFAEMQKVFSELAKISTKKTHLVQMVAFSQPRSHLPKYLELIDKAGFEEINLSSRAKRQWRKVPNRKWHAMQSSTSNGNKEVLLVHRFKGL